MKRLNFFSIIACCSLLLTACDTLGLGGAEEVRMEGTRISILELQEKLIADAVEEQVEIPKPWRNEFWPQAGGYPNHSMQHLALSETLDVAWVTDIGEGSEDDIPLTGQPVVIGSTIYTLDTSATLQATSIENGEKIWEQYIGSEDEKDDPVITGGLAFGERILFATNGLNELIALRPQDGVTLWRKKMPSPSQAAPTILDGRVYVITIDNRLIAFSALDGQMLWEYAAINEGTGLVGSAPPAANREIVIPAFSTGEVAALRVENGALAWSDNLDSIKRFGGFATISDIKAPPVIDKGLLIALNFSGQMVAIDIRSGMRIWQRDIGGSNIPWVAGDSVFVLSEDNHLLALNRKTGLIYWVEKIQDFEDMEDREGAINWQGPILAGDRLVLVSSIGDVLEIDPFNGNTLNKTEIDDGISIPPVVAGQTLYLLSNNAKLYALR